MAPATAATGVLHSLPQGVRPASRLPGREETLIEVPAVFSGVLGGLRRGATAQVTGPGATSVALALTARATQQGAWCAAVALPGLGCAAADELGVALDRLVVVPDPGDRWSSVVAALVEGFDIVISGPPRAPSREIRRLAGRIRERRCAHVVVGRWPERCDTRLECTATVWHGIDAGHGHLRARTIELRTERNDTTLWLPGPDGSVSVAGRERLAVVG